MKTRLAFYVHRGTIYDHAIALAKSCREVHVEICFPDGWCWSSSPRDGGTRSKAIIFEPGRWEFVELTLTAGQVARLRDWCMMRERQNRGYDWLGIFATQGVPLNIHNRDKDFCSEFCVRGLQAVGYLPKEIPAHQVAPHDLRRLVLAAEWAIQRGAVSSSGGAYPVPA